MRKVITTLHYSRPVYTRQVLKALSECIGIEDYLILAYVHEGHNPEVLQLLNDINFCERRVYNENLNIQGLAPVERLGTATGRLLTLGFEESDYVIHFEDDIIPSPDALKYWEWARDKYRDDEKIWSISGYHRFFDISDANWIFKNDRYRLSRRRWFHPWGWATWQNRWKEIQPRWSINGWDNNMWWGIMEPLGGYELFPFLPRTKNIGSEGGANVPSASWHLVNQDNSRWWAGSVELQQGTYWEQENESEFRPEQAIR